MDISRQGREEVTRIWFSTDPEAEDWLRLAPALSSRKLRGAAFAFCSQATLHRIREAAQSRSPGDQASSALSHRGAVPGVFHLITVKD